jgi:hypothetical protein
MICNSEHKFMAILGSLTLTFFKSDRHTRLSGNGRNTLDFYIEKASYEGCCRS